MNRSFFYARHEPEIEKKGIFKMKLIKKYGKKAAALIFLTAGTLTIGGCGGRGQSGPNIMTFDISHISDIVISYDEEEITFMKSADDKLMIKEYMSDSKSRYFAKVDQKKDTIKISEGKKPFPAGGFTRHVEVYLPDSYQKNLTVTTTNGSIELQNIELNMKSLRVDSTSGKIKIKHASAEAVHISTTSSEMELGNLEGDSIRLETTSGSVQCTEVSGNVTCTSTSGDVVIQSASGSGSFRNENSGKLCVEYVNVDGDLTFYNKNGEVAVTLPEDFDFIFEAETKNGTVSVPFEEELVRKGRTMEGTVGDKPETFVKAETKNGDIRFRFLAGLTPAR